MTTAPVADGRTARKAATRDAIADALLDLLGEGHLRPTAREIAHRAGISVRSVYVHFDDLEDLFCVAAGRAYARAAPILERSPDTGSLRDRARAFVDLRAQLYARMGSVARATQLQAPFSPTLARIVRDSHQRSRREIEGVFKIELDTMSKERSTGVVAIVHLLTGAQSWEMLRETHGLRDEEARHCVLEAIVAAIEAGA